KLSVHSGSDKFSLYSIIHRAVKKFDAGLHVKTAGTTWLEEVIGLAASGGEGLKLAKEVYAQAVQRYDELCKPYLTVIEIEKAKLPDPKTVNAWSAEEYVAALRHDQQNPRYDRNFRQLVHVSFRVAAEMGPRYVKLLNECRQAIETNVSMNLYDRHIRPLFVGKSAEKSGSSRDVIGRVETATRV
ncbi:MAG TPA: tagaturonate epimerase family protein, partial [Bacteroidota bacterium]